MITVAACGGHPGSVDLVDTRALPGADPIHLSAAEWAEFIAAVKAGAYDTPGTAPGHQP